jgi:NADH-ubiquinone oxidoreductase chain 6
MNTLFIIASSHLQEYLIGYLNLFATLSIVCAILVIINKNPIVSVLFLICLFVFISGYLIFLGMNFIGLSYLLVYIGAVSILFLFILMLINIRISEIQSETGNSLPLAIIISISFYIALYEILPSNIGDKDTSFKINNDNKIEIIESLEKKNEEIFYLISDQ